MRLIYKRWQWTNHSKSTISRLTRRRRRTRKRLLRRHASPFGLPGFRAETGLFLIRKAPERFSLIDNYAAVLDYLLEIGQLLRRGQNVTFDMSSVTELNPDAILLMASFLHDFALDRSQYRGHFKGNAPQIPELREMFTNSGFYDWVTSAIPKHRTTYTNQQFVRLRHGKIVDPALAKSVKDFASEKLPHIDRKYCKTLYKTLIECMANSNNHAFDRKKLGRWWVIARFNERTNGVRFVFLDRGKTIPHTVIKKTMAERVADKIQGIVRTSEDASLILSALNGELRTATGKPNRGKGLPMILDASRSNHITNLTIISRNGAYSQNSGSSTTPLAFPGTLLAWDFCSGENSL